MNTQKCKQVSYLKKIREIVIMLLFSIPFGLHGQCNEGRFLVRLEDKIQMVFSVDRFQIENKLIDTIRIANSKSRVLYNGFGHLYLVSKDDEWNYYLDSIGDNRSNQCSTSRLGNMKFSSFLAHIAKKNVDHGLISDLERGRSELKCNESYCVMYHLGLRLFKGLEENGEIIYPRESFVGGKFAFDFFQEKYLVFMAHYNKPNLDFGSRVYFFDLEKKKLLWSYRVQSKFQILDVKVVGDKIYLVFRKVSPKGYSYPPAPSLCIVATIDRLGIISDITFRTVEGFDGTIIDIL